MNNNKAYYQRSERKITRTCKNTLSSQKWYGTSKKYEKNIEERLQEQDQNKYRELSNQEKDLKIIYGRNR